MSAFTKTLIVDCDGGQGSDYTTIKEAADALGNNGGTIIVESGVYELDDTGYQTTIDVYSNMSIIGRGKVIISVTDPDIPVFRNSDQTNGNERITISGFTIRLDLGSSYACDAIHLKKVKHCALENLTIFNDGEGTPANNKAAILIEGSGSEDESCRGNTIAQCDIANFYYGIHQKGWAKETMLLNNTVHDCISSGVYYVNSPKNVTSGNSLYGNGDDGMRVQESDDNIIQNNQIYGNDYCGLYLYASNHCAVQGNVCRENIREGIYLSGSSSAPCYYDIISGNICNGNGNDQVTSVMRSGIYLGSYVMYTTVTGNNCYDNYHFGIEEKDDASTGSNLFVGNVCLENSDGNIRVSTKSDNSSNKISV